MSANTIRSALGLLQDDPDHEAAWQDLEEAVTGQDPSTTGMNADELAKLLEAARRAHEMRREYEAVARILSFEVAIAHATAREKELQQELARVYEEELLDDAGAVAAYRRLLELSPGHTQAEDALEKSDAKRAKWSELMTRYLDEAKTTSARTTGPKTTNEGSFKSSLLVTAAEVAYRYGRPQLEAEKRRELVDELLRGLEEALAIDPKNRRAQLLLERVYRQEGRWEDLARVLEGFANEASAKDEKIVGFVRLARAYSKKLHDSPRAMSAYERVIDLSPTHPEATSALVDHFTEQAMWDHLVALYDGQLQVGGMRSGQEPGIVLQIAMVHWKMRGRPEAAEPYFDRLRKSEPAHPGMLDFFREWCAGKGEHTRLATILSDAQRTMPDGPGRQQIAVEIAKLAEEGANAQKAIEQWRALLRQNPSNQEARDALKRLYRATAGWNALTDLLRQQLERLPPDDAETRLPVLREIAGVYRDHIRSDSALVTVLTQMTALDPTDAQALRELARAYQALQRWRDLLTTQTRLAEVEGEPSVKGELYRAIARRWLDQFSNVQNAVEAFEKLHKVAPDDREAVEKLRELYAKRRAYRPLYELLAEEAERLTAGPERRDLWTEMAKLAAERLDRGAEATKLYKRVLEEDPDALTALDSLEKQAERDKDYATVAEALTRRADLAADDAGKLQVLQKLGAVYSDRLHDHTGAVATWRRVLELSPGHTKALRVLRDSHLAIGDYDGLTELYATGEDWEGLVDVLSSAADKTTDPKLKVELSFRAADVYTKRLGAPERAFRAYERVLSVQPSDRRAAGALVPLYEADEKWGRLPALYEVLLSHAERVEDKLALLDRLVKVTGQQLQDRAAAFRYAQRSYELAPETPDTDGALERFEKAARAASQWQPFVDTLAARLAGRDVSASVPRPPLRPESKRIVQAKLAEVYAAEMGRVDEAVTTYRTLVEENVDDDHAVQTLDRILRKANRRDDLRWLFGVRIDRAADPQKLALLSEWAVLEEEAFAEPERATALYRRMLEVQPHHGPALRALARLLRAAGDARGAAEVLEEDRDQREGAERAERELELARLYIDPLRRASDALAAAKRALALVPNDGDAIFVIEELLKIGDTRARAAVILEQCYEAIDNPRRQADVLEVMIATTAAHADRLALYHKLADVHEQKLGAVGPAFDVLARAVGEAPAELSLWDRLAVLSGRAQRAQAFVAAIVQAVPPTGMSGLPEAVEQDLAERAATLYDEKLGETAKARPYLERILARDPNNERAFVRLKQILTVDERWEELETLYEATLAASDERTRRTELLTEIALVAEGITGERVKAIGFYERILDIDPIHEQAMRALEVLYAGEGRWENLAGLLKRRLAATSSEDSIALKLRLGSLYYSRLDDPTAALGYLEEVLHAVTANNEARQLVEKILEVPTLRSRAAAVLEHVYMDRDEVPDLVRVLEIHLELAKSDGERRDLLRRVAELRDERLRDDTSAFEAFARLVPLDPEDVRARTRMLEIARRLGAYERAAEVLAASAESAGVPLPRAEILTDVARIYETHLHDAVRAEAAYRRVLEIAPDDATIALPASRALERVYATAGKHQELCSMLRIEVKLEEDVQVRRDLFGRLGELCETVLDDPPGAVDAWRARLHDDPADEEALGALDRLYERTGDWRALVDVLRSRERLANDRETRKALLVRIATTLADKLNDVGEALHAYRTIVDDFGPEPSTLAALEELYEADGRWEDLADTLETHLTIIDGSDDKLGLLARLGAVRQDRLAEITGAIEVYRQALALDPSHPASRVPLEGLLENEEAQREIAGILRPLYEAEADHEKLLKVLEIETGYADSIDVKLSILARASDVAESALADPIRAFGYASRALREAAAEPELPRWLLRTEQLARSTGRHGPLVELLREVVPEIPDGDLQLEVTRNVAGLARTELGDAALARTYYKKALELREDDPVSLEALERLYEETADGPALLEILKRRAEISEDEEERKALLFKQARLSDQTLQDVEGAITVYEQILEMGLDMYALEVLERLYTSSERWHDLLALFERQLGVDGLSSERKATLHHKLGDVHEKRLGDVDRAFSEYEAALVVDAQHAATVTSLEGLLSDRAQATRAAEMLESVYLVRLDWRRVMVTIEARLDASDDPEERRQLLRRLSKLHEEQEEDYRASLETTAKLLAEDLTDEQTWGELERLARVANAEGRLAEIYAGELAKVSADEPPTATLAARTGELFEAQGETERALVFYRRAYAFDPENSRPVFDAIDRLLSIARRPEERVTLYREVLAYRDDPQDRIATLHTTALIEEEELRDLDAAIHTYRAALDVDEGDAPSLEALTRLYAETERWLDLAELTRRRAEHAMLGEDEARFRYELGKLLEQKLNDPASAIEEYRAAVDLGDGGETSHRSIAALEALLPVDEHKARLVEILRPIYERADDWRNVVTLNADRLALASDDRERAEILRENARLWEDCGRDLVRAFDAVRDAFVLDPEDGIAREGLDRLAAATRRWDDLAAAYEKAIEVTDGLAQSELLGALARLHDRERDDPRRALDAWERMFKKDESDIGPLEEMEGLATLLSDWPILVRVLAKKAELLTDDDAAASTWRRIGETRRDMLEDASGAIDAYERALELEPTGTFTLDCLIALFEQRSDAARLVDLYRRRVELCGDDEQDLKYRMLVEAANCYEVGLHTPREAIDTLAEALNVRPGDAEVLGRLDALYTSERMWPELLENLRAQAEAATDQATRLAAVKRTGALLERELDDAHGALEAWRDVLAADYDEEAVAAIRSLGETRDDLRAEATDALEPVLRAAGRYADVIEVLEMRLRAQGEPQERAQTLRSLAQVAEGHLADPTAAQAALIRALGEEPGDSALHEEIERLAGRLGPDGWRAYADALSERAGALFDAGASDLFVRLGKVAEEQLGDDARAAKAYVSATERAGDDADVLAALDRLFGRLGDPHALADVLERRTALESDPAAQAVLYHRLASLQIREFGEKAQGLSTLRLALERAPEHAESLEAVEGLLEQESLFDEAFDALEVTYRTLGRYEAVAKLYERRLAKADTVPERTRARLELARVLEEQANEPARAQAVVEQALREDGANEDALRELERLAEARGGWGSAVGALAEALASPEAVDLPRATQADLWLRLAIWRRDKADDPRGAEEAFARALTYDAENLETLRSLENLRRGPGRERDLVEVLRSRARAETDVETKRELLREAKRLAESVVADKALAEEVLRDLLIEDEGDAWALEELTRLRQWAGDGAEVVTLLLRRAEISLEGTEVLALKHRAAEVLMDDVGDVARATSLYEEILEGEPSDMVAAKHLRRLYAEAGRERDLGKLLGKLIDVAPSAGQRSSLRLELAELQDDKFGVPADAIDTLRSLLDEEPNNADAVVVLSQLYEKTGDDGDLAELLESQLERARERGDVTGELTLLVRLGEVYEGRLEDVSRAQDAYEGVLSRDPVHRGALEATARMAERRSLWDRAITPLEKLLEQSSDGTGAGYALRLAVAREKMDDAPGVESALRRALDRDPQNAAARARLRTIYEKEKRWADLAALLVGEADSLRDSNPGMKTAAVQLTPGASTPPPPLPEPLANQVKLLRRAAEIHLEERKAPEDAIAVLERAAELVPHDRDLLLLLCDTYNTTGRAREAANVLEKVIASFGNKRTKELSQYHHRLGRALAQLGDKDVALAQFDMAFKIDPGSVTVLRDLGVLAFEANDLDRAQKTFRALLLQRLEPNTGISKGEVFYYLGEISAKQGDKTKAVQMLERAIENEPTLERAKSKLTELKGN